MKYLTIDRYMKQAMPGCQVVFAPFVPTSGGVVIRVIWRGCEAIHILGEDKATDEIIRMLAKQMKRVIEEKLETNPPTGA